MYEVSLTRNALFSMSPKMRRAGRAGFEIQNISKLPREGNVLEPKRGTRGFPEYPEPPLLRIMPKLGRPSRDMEHYHAFWLVSGSAKDVLTSASGLMGQNSLYGDCKDSSETWKTKCPVITGQDSGHPNRDSTAAEEDRVTPRRASWRAPPRQASGSRSKAGGRRWRRPR